VKFARLCSVALVVPLLFAAGCAKKIPDPSAAAKPAKHEHHAPHGGTPVVLGNEAYHLELVLDPAAGKLQAFVLDGEMENFIRSTAPSFEVLATVAGKSDPLLFVAIADSATGEKIGDTALFEATAPWLKTTRTFDGVLTKLEIRGTTFTAVPFNFPKGNDKD
jgi:hypothetical protein